MQEYHLGCSFFSDAHNNSVPLNFLTAVIGNSYIHMIISVIVMCFRFIFAGLASGSVAALTTHFWMK